MNKYRCSIKEPDCCPADLIQLYHPLALWQWNLFQQKSSILTRCFVCDHDTHNRTEAPHVTCGVTGVVCLMSFIFFVLSLFCFLPYFLFSMSWNKLFGPVGGSCSAVLKSRLQVAVSRLAFLAVYDVPQDGTWNRSQPLPSASFPIHYSVRHLLRVTDNVMTETVRK
jgi:hypothetical protein